MIYFTIGVAILLMVVMVLLFWGGRRGSGGIVLPEATAGARDTEEDGGESRLNVVAITPQTVRPAVSTLSRPASYSRSQVVETFWSGGSGQSASQVYVNGGRTRIDTQLSDGSVRHTLLWGDASAVWYDGEETWTILRTPLSSQRTASLQYQASDLAGRMPTYETVLDLPVEDIAAADYRERDGVYCVYVETAVDSGGYGDRYWVSVENGLLYAAERVCDGELVYRFTAGQLETGTPEESLFLLPDGSAPDQMPPAYEYRR